jgi:hypothetical protein
LKSTHTLATMAISQAAFMEVHANMLGAGYEQAIDKLDDGTDLLDMTGIGLVPNADAGIAHAEHLASSGDQPVPLALMGTVAGRDWLLQEAVRVIQAAQDLGFVLTIDLVPRRPLAMGNYEMLATVRPERGPRGDYEPPVPPRFDPDTYNWSKAAADSVPVAPAASSLTQHARKIPPMPPTQCDAEACEVGCACPGDCIAAGRAAGLTPADLEPVEIRVRISAEVISGMKLRLGIEKNIEVIQEALTMLNWASEEKAAGRVILSAAPDGTRVVRLAMECLNTEASVAGLTAKPATDEACPVDGATHWIRRYVFDVTRGEAFEIASGYWVIHDDHIASKAASDARISELQADLSERDTRIASMRAEWGAEVAALTERAEKARAWSAGMQCRLNAAESRAHAAEADAKRLDWMIYKQGIVGWTRDGDSCRVWVAHDEYGNAQPATSSDDWFYFPRAAIDAAMKEQDQ